MSADTTRLLITGKMGSGKGFAAAYLAENFGAQRWSRTEMMKALAHAIVDGIGDPDEVLSEIFADPDQRDEVRLTLLDYAADYVPEPGKPRRMYQEVTEICQDEDPLCFEVELDRRIRDATAGSTQERRFSLIDDVRSAAAFAYFTSQGYASLRIDAPEEVRRRRMLERDGYLPAEETFNHPSETELDDVPHDFVVVNDGTDLDAFYADLRAVAETILSGSRKLALAGTSSR